jgi:hypothetical protein
MSVDEFWKGRRPTLAEARMKALLDALAPTVGWEWQPEWYFFGDADELRRSDFVEVDARLAIEVDGGHHETCKETQRLDAEKTLTLRFADVETMRFRNSDVLNAADIYRIAVPLEFPFGLETVRLPLVLAATYWKYRERVGQQSRSGLVPKDLRCPNASLLRQHMAELEEAGLEGYDGMELDSFIEDLKATLEEQDYYDAGGDGIIERRAYFEEQVRNEIARTEQRVATLRELESRLSARP